MRTRTLGPSGIDASVIGLGSWAIGGWMWGGTETSEAVRAIQAGLDAGVNLIDTAPIYGFGTSEEIVGEAIADRRDEVVLATKCGLIWHEPRGDKYFESDETQITEGGKRKVFKCLAPDTIRYEVEQSLKRLRTDRIDLYQTHWQESTTPIADTMGALVRLQEEGKIRAIGVSNATPDQMDDYRSGGRLDSDQEQYSMLDRQHETANLPYCERHDIAFLAYSPLALGLLSGKMTPDRTFGEGDMRAENPRFSPENLRKVTDLLESFRPIAEGHGLTLAQLVIAWTVHQPGCTHALVGARKEPHAVENAAAGDVELSDAELDTMRAAIEARADSIG